eukprot:TRINITY_DN22383_c1_g1_i5.p1 TRINITY_DN22383_c1_g1~~TRINITY_DN22383_c1_g1_i5.p1  ORF type:complete len:434 (-),score=75.22 TRINITY_DN22383_c1_g1_i5:50-1351(-)
MDSSNQSCRLVIGIPLRGNSCGPDIIMAARGPKGVSVDEDLMVANKNLQSLRKRSQPVKGTGDSSWTSGTLWSKTCRQLRDFLSRNEIMEHTSRWRKGELIQAVARYLGHSDSGNPPSQGAGETVSDDGEEEEETTTTQGQSNETGWPDISEEVEKCLHTPRAAGVKRDLVLVFVSTALEGEIASALATREWRLFTSGHWYLKTLPSPSGKLLECLAEQPSCCPANSKLVFTIPPRCKLIVLGDRGVATLLGEDQLKSLRNYYGDPKQGSRFQAILNSQTCLSAMLGTSAFGKRKSPTTEVTADDQPAKRVATLTAKLNLLAHTLRLQDARILLDLKDIILGSDGLSHQVERAVEQEQDAKALLEEAKALKEEAEAAIKKCQDLLKKLPENEEVGRCLDWLDICPRDKRTLAALRNVNRPNTALMAVKGLSGQ